MFKPLGAIGVIGTLVLVGSICLPGSAQSTATPDSTVTPDATTTSPPSTTPPATTTPDTTVTPNTPNTTITPNSTVTPNSTTSPAVPVSSSSPSTSGSMAKTMSPDRETITGATEVNLPAPPVAPVYFTLPMEIKITKDAAVTSNTPITDKMTSNYSAWADAIRACSQQKPAFVRIVGDEAMPFMVGGSDGTIKLNANDKPVCSMS